jgi:superfamily II DNA or RNA helicase
VLNTKANFIAQLRAGARGVRVAEDIDSPLPEAAMIKAAATGDPRIMEHADLTKETQLLEAGLRAHERSRAAARSSYAETVQRIAQLRERIADAEQDAAEIHDISGAKFTLTMNFAATDKTVTFTERRPAGEALVRRLNAEAATAVLSAQRSTSLELGALADDRQDRSGEREGTGILGWPARTA